MIYKNPKASLKGGKKWRFQCASWEVGCLAFVFFFSLTSFHPQSQSQFSVKNVTTKLRGQRVRIQCQKTSSEQASGSEGDKKITVDKKWLRQKQQYSAWVRGWVWKTFCFSDTFKSAKVHTHAQIHTSPSEVLVNHFFPKGSLLKWKCPSPPAAATSSLSPFSNNMCFIDQGAVTWIAVVVRLLSWGCSSAGASKKQRSRNSDFQIEPNARRYRSKCHQIFTRKYWI